MEQQRSRPQKLVHSVLQRFFTALWGKACAREEEGPKQNAREAHLSPATSRASPASPPPLLPGSHAPPLRLTPLRQRSSAWRPRRGRSVVRNTARKILRWGVLGLCQDSKRKARALRTAAAARGLGGPALAVGGARLALAGLRLPEGARHCQPEAALRIQSHRKGRPGQM